MSDADMEQLLDLQARLSAAEAERDQAYAAYRMEHEGRGVDLAQLKQVQARAEKAEAERDRLRERAKSVLWVFDGNATVEERRKALESFRRALKGSSDE